MHSNKKMPTLNSDVNITEHSGNVKINYKFMRFFKNATKINFLRYSTLFRIKKY